MKLLQRDLFLAFVVSAFSISVCAQATNYKFTFIERLATEKFGGSRDMAVAPDGSVFVAGTAPDDTLPVVGPQIVDQKSLKPELNGPSYIQKYDAEGNLIYDLRSNHRKSVVRCSTRDKN